MTAKQLTVTVALDSGARERLKKAAKVQGQSLTAFVEGAAEELARRVLLAWAIDRYIDGNRSCIRPSRRGTLSRRLHQEVAERHRW